jgi:hypothetical protein
MHDLQAPAGSLITTPGGQAVPALQMASMPGLKPFGGTASSTTLAGTAADGYTAPVGASASAPPAPELPFRVGSAPFTSSPVFAAVAASEAAAGVSGRPSSSGGVGMVSSPTVGRKRLRAHRRCNSTMAWVRDDQAWGARVYPTVLQIPSGIEIRITWRDLAEPAASAADP